ncbi:MAG: hypothetical protein AB1555_13700 [Nitrospirota bacterium]
MNHAQDGSGQAGPAGGHRQGPGIVVFSSSLKLLHKNRRAEELTALLTAKDAGPSDIMPAAVQRVCHSILESFSRCRPAPVWVQVSERQTAGEPVRSVLIRGFGLRKDTHTESARIVIVLEESPFGDTPTTQAAPPAPHAL